MIESQEGRQHYLFAVLLFIAGLLIILIFLTVRSQADDTESSATISNATPTVSAVTVATASAGSAVATIDSITEGSTDTVYIHGTITDQNGCEDITGANQGVKMVFYGPGTNAACDQDTADCFIADDGGVYTNSCSTAGCSAGTGDTDLTFECQITAQFYSDPGEWTVSVTANDGTVSSSANTATTSTVAELVGLNLGSGIDYGTLAVGATSASDVSLSVENYGNVELDVNYQGTQMTCDTLYIATGSQKYHLTADTAYGSMVTLTEDDVIAQHDLAKRTQGSASSENSYWKLNVDAGVEGTCTGTVTATAVKSV